MKELSEERAAVVEAVSELWTHENLPFTIWGWEDAKEIPSGKYPDEVQSKGVGDSTIYLLILGSEYGNFGYGESPTQKEYDIACSEHEQDCILIYIKEVGRRREEKLEKWIEEIKNRHTFKSFKNSDQLKDLVKTRLRDLWNKGLGRADIPTIQSALRKGETFEGDFFKKEPEWIDFEEGFVVERKEVDEIINKLENDHIQLVLGEPASGKSVILKNIGFKLANENKDVYVVELKKHSSDEVKRYFDDIPEIKDEKAVFIVDDTHLYLSECERLVREFKNMKSKAKLIIGSRPTREIRGEHPKEASVFEYLNKTDIHAEDVTEEIIKTFLKRKYGFSDERVEKLSENLGEYKKDLWYLSWAVKSYNPEKDTVDEKEIYEKIRDSIREISAGKNKPRVNAEDAFLPLSIFHRFEISVERDFLEKQLEIEEDKINKLIELSEIIETEEIGRNRTLSLIHSSIADLYFKTYQAYPSLGRKTKKNILNQREENLEYRLFHKYMTSIDPRNAIDVVIHLGSAWMGGKGDVITFIKLIDDTEVRDSIKEGIEKEEDTWKIGRCVGVIAKVSKIFGLKLVDSLPINIILSKIEKEEHIGKIGWCVCNISNLSKEMGLKLANRMSVDILPSKIEKEEHIGRIGSCIRCIAEVSKEAGLELAKHINIKNILSKIEKEEDIMVIGIFVSDTARVSEEVGLKLVEAVFSKIEKEEDIETIEWCVLDISLANEEVGLKLVKRINIKNVLTKIEKVGDIEKVRSFVCSIAMISKKVAQEVVNSLNPKLSEELQKGG
jgi:hypothetical protein